MTERQGWPRLLDEIAEDLGEKVALDFAGKAGGLRITVPGKLGAAATDGRSRTQTDRARAKFAKSYGRALAEWLEERFGGEQIAVPRFAARVSAERKRLVLQQPHRSSNDLARDLGVSYRRIEQIRAEAREADDQPSLFD